MKQIDTSKAFTLAPFMQEEFHSLFSSLEFTGMENRVICITSTFPNEGKSYVSYHLAKSIAESNKKVILIDADMRNSSMHRRLGYEKEMIGLSHLLSQHASLMEIMYSTSTENLFVVPTGVFPSNPTTLLRSDRFKKMIVSLRKTVDYIIVDTPPIGMVTDGNIIANICDASLLVIGSGTEHIKIARESVELLKAANDNFLGVILNRMTSDKGGYGSYGKYGRYGGYVYGGNNKNGK